MSDNQNVPPARPVRKAGGMASEELAARRAELGITSPTDGETSADAPPGAAQRRARSRGARRPFGAREQKLAYPDRPGFHRHWFNDEPGRIVRAGEAGYSQVSDEDGKPVSTVVGTARGGGPLVAYLMEIPLEWFNEDREDQDSLVHDIIGQIKQGEHAKPGGRDGQLRYAGSQRGDISIREGDRR